MGQFIQNWNHVLLKVWQNLPVNSPNLENFEKNRFYNTILISLVVISLFCFSILSWVNFLKDINFLYVFRWHWHKVAHNILLWFLHLYWISSYVSFFRTNTFYLYTLFLSWLNLPEVCFIKLLKSLAFSFISFSFIVSSRSF